MTTSFSRILRRSRRFAVPAGLVGLSTLLASCSDDGHVDVYPVSGTVKFGADVPAGAQITLHPVNAAVPENLVAMGTVGADGSFRIGTYDAADGAPVGEYKATIQWFKVVKSEGGVGRGPNVLPKKYADPKTSPVLVKVADAPTDLGSITITR